MKGLSILGSTGSVGTNVLRVVDAFPDRFEVVGLAAGGNVEMLAEQVARHRPKVVSVADATALAQLTRLVDLSGLRAVVGREGMVEVATHPEARMVVASAVGAVGLVPTYRALEAGKDVALANKETLVMAGELMLARARETGARLLPIDSEHCALHQCLDGRRPEHVRRLILTASGGPFRNRPRETFETITREEALAHPTWSMGPKITIDSATLMNKGLEVIEARWLFGVEAEDRGPRPPAVDRPLDGRVRGRHRARPARRHRHAPADPVRAELPREVGGGHPGPGLHEGDAPRVRPARPREVPLPRARLPALEAGGTAPAVLNAANEEAVAAFLDGRAPFLAIPEIDRGGPRGRAAGGRAPPSRTCSRPTPGAGARPAGPRAADSRPRSH